MTYENVDTIWESLKTFPVEGATAKEMATRIGKSQTAVSSRLSKLYHYGFIDRVPAGGPFRDFRYKFKQRMSA